MSKARWFPEFVAAWWLLLLPMLFGWRVAPAIADDEPAKPATTAPADDRKDQPKAGSAVADDEDDEDADDDEGADEDKGARAGKLDEVAPKQLKRARSLRLEGATAHGMKHFDVDGDGTLEYIFSDYRNGLHIVSADGLRARRVRFEGGIAGMGEFQPVRIDGRVCWVVTTSPVGFRPGGDGIIRCFNEKGAKLWTHKVALGRNYHARPAVAAGDLDGDGRAEVAIALSIFRMQSEGGARFSSSESKGYLVVLDSVGKVLCRRKLAGYTDFVAITSPGPKGEPPAIVVSVSGQLLRFDWKSAVAGTVPAGTQPAVGAPGTDEDDDEGDEDE